MQERQNLSLPNFLTISVSLTSLILPNKNLNMAYWGVNSHHENNPIPSWLSPYMINLKSIPNLHVPRSAINMKAMIRHNTKFSPAISSPKRNLFTRLFTDPWQWISPANMTNTIRNHTMFPPTSSFSQVNLVTRFVTSHCQLWPTIVRKSH